MKPTLQHIFAILLVFCEDEVTDDLFIFDVLCHDFSPSLKEPMEVALLQEGFRLRYDCNTPSTSQLSVLIAVLQEVNHPRDKPMWRIENQSAILLAVSTSNILRLHSWWFQGPQGCAHMISWRIRKIILQFPSIPKRDCLVRFWTLSRSSWNLLVWASICSCSSWSSKLVARIFFLKSECRLLNFARSIYFVPVVRSTCLPYQKQPKLLSSLKVFCNS